MKKLFCCFFAAVYLAAAVMCTVFSYDTYVAPLPKGFTVYAPFQRKVFDLHYDENEKAAKTVFSAKETPAELKGQIDGLNAYRYRVVIPARDFLADPIPGRWQEHIDISITTQTGEELYCIATKNYIRVGKFQKSNRDPFRRFRGTLCYSGDTSRLFEAISS